MKLTFNASCGSYIGNARTNNEDNFYFNKKHLSIPNKGLKNTLKCDGTTDDIVMFAVFDGMGGEAMGEEAACLASEVFSNELKNFSEIAVSGKEFFLKTCDKANNAVNKLRISKQLNSIGTTVVALWFWQNEVVGCNVGDSRIYRIRSKKMLQISEDHTDAKIMSAIGIDKKPVLLQYLGVPETEMAIEPYISKGDIQKGDIYILCSDGITDVLGMDEIYDTVSSMNADEAVIQLIAKVKIKDGADNSTIIVVRFDD